MVEIGMPNDGVNDGDNFTGTIKADVPDGFVFDSSRSNGVVTGSNVSDDLGMLNTLGSMEGISPSVKKLPENLLSLNITAQSPN